MKNKLLNAACLCLAAALASPANGFAAPPPDPDTREVGEAIDAFNNALRAGDLEAVSRLLDPHLIVLESGGAERSREEYLAEHAKADAAFLQAARSGDKVTAVKVVGDVAWTTSTATLEYERDGKTRAADTAETMILRRQPEGWKIVHIHWSSHPRSAP